MSIRYIAGRITESIDPLAVPDAPASATATATGKTTASVAFTAPTNTGVSAVTSYSVVPTVGGTVVSGASSPLTATGLSAGTAYTFQVSATNSAGVGPIISSNSVTTLSDPAFINQLSNGTTGFNASNSNFIVAASSGVSYMSGTAPSNSNDWLLAAYNASGAIQWQKTLGSAGSDIAGNVQLDSSGNPHIFGATGLTNGGIGYVKYNSAGTLQFQRRLFVTGVALAGGRGFIDSSNNVYLAGTYNNGSTNVVAGVIAKYDNNATIQWQRQFGNTAGQSSSFYLNLSAITVDSSGNVYGLGNAGSYTYAYIWKYDSSGTFQWQRRISPTFKAPYQNGIATDSSGNVYITLGNANYPNGAIWTLKYNSSGVLQWQRAINPPSGNTIQGYSLTVDSSGFVYVAGYYANSPTGAVIAKYNSSGTIQWQRSVTTFFNGNANPIGQIAVDNNGSYYLGIYRVVPTTYYPNYYLFKLPDDGSKTGTYVVDTNTTFTYAVTTFTESAASLTDEAGNLTSSTPAYTDSSMILTEATSTYTSTTIAL